MRALLRWRKGAGAAGGGAAPPYPRVAGAAGEEVEEAVAVEVAEAVAVPVAVEVVEAGAP